MAAQFPWFRNFASRFRPHATVVLRFVLRQRSVGQAGRAKPADDAACGKTKASRDDDADRCGRLSKHAPPAEIVQPAARRISKAMSARPMPRATLAADDDL